MAFSYNLANDVGKLRLLIMDNQVSSYLFEDTELSLFVALESNSVKRGAALALETMASNEAYVLKRIELLDLKTDGPAVAKELRERANGLRAQAEREESYADGGAFDIAEMVVDDFTARQRLLNEALRDG